MTILRAVRLEPGDVVLEGLLEVPGRAIALVVFAHGSGSSRASPRNRHVAAVLQSSRIATLLFDLLTEDEDADPRRRFDVTLLARRLAAAIAWARGQAETRALPIGLFGASTGAAAALLAAADDAHIAAVVSRGGRPDLAGAHALAEVRAPTLLIVGGHDEEVTELNRAAYALMRCERSLEIVPGATHLFPEPGALDRVAELAAGWFAGHAVEKAP